MNGLPEALGRNLQLEVGIGEPTNRMARAMLAMLRYRCAISASERRSAASAPRGSTKPDVGEIAQEALVMPASNARPGRQRRHFQARARDHGADPHLGAEQPFPPTGLTLSRSTTRDTEQRGEFGSPGSLRLCIAAGYDVDPRCMRRPRRDGMRAARRMTTSGIHANATPAVRRPDRPAKPDHACRLHVPWRL